MPVTIHPSPHPAESALLHPYPRATSPEQLLASITTHESPFPSPPSSPGARRRRTILQSSFSSPPSRTSSVVVHAAKNGLVYTILEAYNHHHNLLLRPDDVWVAILSQLSVYINGSSSSLRHLFVGHQGRKELFIEVDLHSPSLDHGAVAAKMVKLMGENLKGGLDQEFVIPDFTTTGDVEKHTAAVVWMGVMQRFFVYEWGTRCGIPGVTLLGEVEDWVKIYNRAATFIGKGAFGPAAARWFSSPYGLGPVLQGFIQTFKQPDSQSTKHFWQTVVKRNEPNGSGGLTYSGWLVGAFCWFDERGRLLGGVEGGREIGRNEVPMGFVTVPVTLVDGGEKISTEMVGGLVGIEAVEGGGDGDWVMEEGRGDGRREMGRKDTLKPVMGWVMYKT
ncbi:hypothetical protein QBC35DRAFT_377960 [Podospora australis]|uniref:Uncharacterized protein n=1 Tax=Podospora australis TaxID=1536484 RepID=A0AAN7AKT2_9PEZI|nr:hypothetical protein QBC35DRAFT_377960 [Podospora australis]